MAKEAGTPLMKQYEDLKSRHPDEILLFRLGDFYEIFGEDAKKAAPLLEIALTQRQGVPMCGIPYHAVNRYLPKLLKEGHRIAIAEQLEDPASAKGIVKRDVTRTISAGTLLEENLLHEKSNNFLAALSYNSEHQRIGLAALDISTGEFHSTEFEASPDRSKLSAELTMLRPSEILLEEGSVHLLSCLEGIPHHFIKSQELKEFDGSSIFLNSKMNAEKFADAANAARMVARYLAKMNPKVLPNLQPLKFQPQSETMILDRETILNLELLKNSDDGGEEKTLFDFLDYPWTPMGGRLLKQWVTRPLVHLDKIEERTETVRFFLEESALRKSLRGLLKGVSDIERMIMRIASGHLSPRDFIGLKLSLSKIENVRKTLNSIAVPTKIEKILDQFENWSEFIALLERSLAEDPPTHLDHGGAIRPGYHAELDEKRKAAQEGKVWLQSLESQEKEKTAIPTLKIGYTSVFGYYFEVTKPHLSKVPTHWFRKQTLVNAERYISEELKDLEEKILGAEEQAVRIEKALLEELAESAKQKIQSLQKTGQGIAEIDCLLALAEAAELESLSKPKLSYSESIQIKEGWHPVVQSSLPNGSFVPNDVLLDSADQQVIILTGPNMSGKSTFLRQTALIVLMAQIGSFVPAEEAQIGIVDRIFTRIGSGDRLAKGASTFLVEMQETAKILQQATGHSLIILDEVGRGTSTYDGISIAWSIIEYLLNRIKPKVLFATHYFELTGLAQEYEGVKNYNVEAKEWRDSVIFLHKIVPGPADRSYGIHVAQLAGLPPEVIERSKKILKKLEVEHQTLVESNKVVQQAKEDLKLPLSFDPKP